MSDNSYAAPRSNLTGNSAVDAQALLEPLLATKPWVRFLSILGFIFTGLMVLVAFAIMAGGMAISSAVGGGAAALPGAFMGFFYLLFALLYFFPSLYLFKYASAIARASQSGANDEIQIALGYQKSVWKFVGIVAAVFTVIIVLLLLLGLFTGFMAASSM